MKGFSVMEVFLKNLNILSAYVKIAGVAYRTGDFQEKKY